MDNPLPMMASIRRLIVIGFCLSATAPWLGGQEQATSQNIPSVVAGARGTVVLLKTFDRSGQVLALGSGFRISSGRFVTNAHVVAGASRVEVYDDTGAILGIAHTADMLSTSVDLAILSAGRARGRFLTLAPRIPPVGEHVIVIGAPEGLTNTVSDGIVSAVRKVEGRQLLQITAPISPGSSGGPVLNTRGQVVGVSVSILDKGQNLNFAVPVSDLIALVSSRPGNFDFPETVAESPRARTRSNPSQSSASPAPRALTMDGVVNGLLTRQNETSAGDYVDYYTLEGPSHGSVSISVASVNFLPFVGIFRLIGDSVVALGASDPDSRLLSATASATLSEGVDYVVIVGSSNASQTKTGSYTVWVRPGAADDAAAEPEAADADSRWLPAGQTKSFVDEFDKTQIVNSGYGTYRVWERQTLSHVETTSSGKRYDSMIMQYEISCSDNRYRYLSGIAYLAGEVAWSSSDPGKWTSAVPESVGETENRVICEYIKAHGL